MFLRTLWVLTLLVSGASAAQDLRPAIAIHGGAGTIRPFEDPELERQYRDALARAARAGYLVLTEGGSSLDAVQAAVMRMEDDPLFNAGKGAVFNHDGVNELDAAIMDGATGQAGAVAGLQRVRNPILAARAVMDHSPHVLLFGDGAEVFARQQGLELVEPGYFFTPRRWERLQELLNEDPGAEASVTREPDALYSTVGAVAIDRHGDLAAATSTGGLTNKRYGRVGDVPVIGAGTYADNATCAVSATGHGEYFIRNVVAHDICARMAYKGTALEHAAREVVMEKLVAQGGEGGVIAVDREGHLALVFNTTGMYRAAIDREGRLSVGIFEAMTVPGPGKPGNAH